MSFGEQSQYHMTAIISEFTEGMLEIDDDMYKQQIPNEYYSSPGHFG